MSLQEQATYDPKNLISGNAPALVTEPETVASGQAALARGTVMGRVDLGAVSKAAKSVGNTGEGTLTLDATTPKLAGAQAGVYAVRVIVAATGGGTLRVSDPKGNVLGDVAVGGTFANQVKFATAASGADFIVGDGFDITVAAGSGEWVKSLAASVDGSQHPRGILAEDCDAESVATSAPIYKAGCFDPGSDIMTFGTGHTAATVRAAFDRLGIGIVLRAARAN